MPAHRRATAIARAPEPAAEAVRGSLVEWISSESFSCLGGKASLRRGILTCAELGTMGTGSATAALHAGLRRFVLDGPEGDREDGPAPAENFRSFVALFDGPTDLAEPEFERLLWLQLARLHRLDRREHAWAPGVDIDTESGDFGFSAVGHPFFVVGLHPQASRISRRFCRPALAFNSHHQFRRLKANGSYDGLRRKIRDRELRLQHSINPNLADFGEVSEARQYSGRPVGPAWTCPVSLHDT